jgi:DNA-binding GntR family transcriptional regulator
VKAKIPVNLTLRAYEAIRDQIITGKLDGRRHLTEEVFVRDFGISKSPIREALNRLESEGLIRISPRRGTFVAELSIHDVEEIFELRKVLEGLAVRDAVLDRETLSQMRASVQAASVFLRKNDVLSYTREDTKFHSLLAQSSKNSRLRKILENIRDQMSLLRWKTFELASHTSIEEHSHILDALEKGQRDVAEKLVAQHIEAVQKCLTEYMKKQDSKSSSTHELRQQPAGGIKPARTALA